jgi:hypothetical protein
MTSSLSGFVERIGRSRIPLGFVAESSTNKRHFYTIMCVGTSAISAIAPERPILPLEVVD